MLATRPATGARRRRTFLLAFLCCVLSTACAAPAPAASQIQPSATSGSPDDVLPGWPGPTTTGVPEGTVLTPSAGLYLDVPDQVVTGLLVRGCVVVAAPRVTIRNSHIQCWLPTVDRAVRPANGADSRGLVIEDSEIDGNGVVDIGVDISGVTIRRANIHSFNDGIRMGSELVVEDSWIHDMTRIGSLHADAIQGISARDVVITGNRLDPTNADSSDLNNAAVQLGSETGTMISSDVLIEGNYLDGGNYSLNVSGAITAENITIRDNTFGDGSRYGPVIAPDDDEISISDDNHDAGTNESIDVDRPR